MKALITGASRGLGRELARALDEWDLILTARDPAALRAVTDELGAAGIAGDVADAAHRARLAEAASGADLLVNNASTLGVVPLPPLADYPLDALAEAFQVNTIAPLALYQAIRPRTVLNITSDAAREPYEGWGGYGATKAALEQLSNILAAEQPDRRVWWVDPGEMRTRMLADAGEDLDAARDPAEVAAALRALVTSDRPSGRYTLGDPQ